VGKRTVRQDIRGIFVHVDGQIFRPQLNVLFFGNSMPCLCLRPPTALRVGMVVKVSHLQDSLWAKVGEEDWCYHGNHMYWTPDDGDMKRPTAECWNLGIG
jgi:hypothetical protein